MSKLHHPMMKRLVLFIVALHTSHSSFSSTPVIDYGANLHTNSRTSFVMSYLATSV